MDGTVLSITYSKPSKIKTFINLKIPSYHDCITIHRYPQSRPNSLKPITPSREYHPLYTNYQHFGRVTSHPLTIFCRKRSPSRHVAVAAGTILPHMQIRDPLDTWWKGVGSREPQPRARMGHQLLITSNS